MAKTEREPHYLCLHSRQLLAEKKNIPLGLLCKVLRCAAQGLLTHLKSFSLEGILHSSSGRMSFLKGPVRAQRLSKSLTQVFPTCQAPPGKERPRCTFPGDCGLETLGPVPHCWTRDVAHTQVILKGLPFTTQVTGSP